ncbi:MAG TPA: hypothetical protein DHW82_00250 [Spirochaetia bacterium]|nr:MAG: hypothetical protein A2Y41_00890 [Spirochaetes bacterium GWB1_36_13]HCL55432.1 hypothetical protein [Spirochaetia bacterium]
MKKIGFIFLVLFVFVFQILQADENEKTDFKEPGTISSLFQAVVFGNLEMLQKLIDEGKDINEKNWFDETPLYLAVRDHQIKILDFLLDQNALLNLENSRGMNPLFLAVKRGNAQMVKKILEKAKNLDINQKDKFGNTLIFYSQLNGNKEIETLLLSKGALKNKDDEKKIMDFKSEIERLHAIASQTKDIEASFEAIQKLGQMGYADSKTIEILFQILNRKYIDPYAKGDKQMKKPNIYLYPEKEEKLTVSLEIIGKMTESIPDYQDGWKVRVEPSGLINGKYRFLFYEANVSYPFTLDSGWVMTRKSFHSEMSQILDQIGLNQTEKADFMEYWTQKLLWEKPYYLVYWIKPQELDQAAKLTISKKPDSILRILFYFVPSSQKEDITPPEIKPFERKGFTVVEWGGAIKDKSVLFSLFWSVISGNIEEVKKILLTGKNINIRTPFFKETAFYLAVRDHQTEMIDFLFDHGADITIPNKKGFTPLDLAYERGNQKIIDQILKKCQTMDPVQNKYHKNTVALCNNLTKGDHNQIQIEKTMPNIIIPIEDIERLILLALEAPDYETRIKAIQALLKIPFTEHTRVIEILLKIFNEPWKKQEKKIPQDNWHIRKPNIYLYPEKEEELTVSLEIMGKMTASIPDYQDGWKVKAEPSGLIDGKYQFLFYEADVSYPFTLDSAWVMTRKSFHSEMSQILDQIGLNPTEKADFMEYWTQKLSWEKPYYLVYWIKPQELDEAAALKISKKPDAILRILFYFEPSDQKKKIPLPKIKPFERKGFTVVEWGGAVYEKGKKLFIAVRNGDLNQVKNILEKSEKKNINQKNDIGKTPLFYATLFRYDEIVKYLIGKGASINKEDEKEILEIQNRISELNTALKTLDVCKNTDQLIKTIRWITHFSKTKFYDSETIQILINILNRPEIKCPEVEKAPQNEIKQKKGGKEEVKTIYRPLKPNIYLYPEKEDRFFITLTMDGKITKSIPDYQNGWNVKVAPSGLIDNRYPFLFYEAEYFYHFTLDSGWVMTKESFHSEMSQILDQIWLNQTEKADFMEYWTQKLSWEKPYYLVYWIKPQELDQAAKLTISKNPDSILRILFYFVPSSQKEDITPPEIKPFKRKGFTVVEWGGAVKEK